jgi:hypothetical protein
MNEPNVWDRMSDGLSVSTSVALVERGNTHSEGPSSREILAYTVVPCLNVLFLKLRMQRDSPNSQRYGHGGIKMTSGCWAGNDNGKHDTHGKC